jgi:hypothetical protein
MAQALANDSTHAGLKSRFCSKPGRERRSGIRSTRMRGNLPQCGCVLRISAVAVPTGGSSCSFIEDYDRKVLLAWNHDGESPGSPGCLRSLPKRSSKIQNVVYKRGV